MGFLMAVGRKRERAMLNGSVKIDVPVYSDDPSDKEQGIEPTFHGIELFPEDFSHGPENPGVFRATRDHPKVEVIARVNANGSVSVTTSPSSKIIENTLHT